MDLDYFKKHLEKEEISLKKQIEYFSNEDPFKNPDHTSEDYDEGLTQSESHDRIVAVREELETRLNAARAALARIEKGTFGICSNCGQKIEEDRLKIVPTATLCLSCEQARKA